LKVSAVALIVQISEPTHEQTHPACGGATHEALAARGNGPADRTFDHSSG
jgi:hypothetical protein